MELLNNIIVDEIKFIFKFKGEIYTAYTYAIDIEETDMYSCEIKKHKDRKLEDISKFYFDSCGGTTDDLGELESYVMGILFSKDNEPIIKGF